jgi:hypothetical protein
MLMPLRSPRAPRRQVSKIKNFPPPVGGWVSDVNAVGAGMATAIIMENFVPKQNRAFVRNGSKTVCKLPTAAETLSDFDNGISQILVGAAGSIVYTIPVTVNKDLVVADEIGNGFANGRWQTVMMSNGADDVSLVMVNGADGIWCFDGTDLTEAPASAANPTVDNVTSFKSRLWFTKLNDATIYYGEVLSNKPAVLTAFPIGPLLRNGGEIIAINSLSMDGGSGPDDYLVCVSSRGEIVVFSGIDPGTDFQLVGIFKAAKPLSRRCLAKNGSDLMYYGSNGPQLLTRLFSTAEGLETLALPIRTEFEDVMLVNANMFGWDLVGYPKRSWVLFNVPMQENRIADQFVVNLESQSWFRIKGWNGACWTTHETNLYFGDFEGNIKIADFGTSDDGEPINFDFLQSWQEFDTPSKKKFNMAQVTVEADVSPDILVDMNVDFAKTDPKSRPSFGNQAVSSPWDTSPWNTSPWSSSDTFYIKTFGLADTGYVGALRYRGQLKNATHTLYGFRIAYEEGEFM